MMYIRDKLTLNPNPSPGNTTDFDWPLHSCKLLCDGSSQT